MKKSDDIRRKTWRMVAKNLIVIVALAVAAAVGVMSWFTMRSDAYADGLEAECITTDGLQVAVVAPGAEAPDDDEYVEGSLLLSKDTPDKDGEMMYPFMNTLELCEVTSDGNEFWRPTLIQENGVVRVVTEISDDPDKQWILATPNTHYLSFDLYMRSRNACSIQLGSDSYLKPIDTLTAGEGYSKDSVIGAVRMSVLDGNDKKLVWLPAPHVYYDGDYSSDTYNMVFLNSTPESVWDTYKHYYYSGEKQRLNYNSETSFFVTSTPGTYKLGSKIDLIDLDTVDSNGYYSDHVRVNVWIEGEDAEARLALVQGRFKLSMDLEIK